MIAIIKYNAGNATSVRYALQRLGCGSLLTDNREEIENADKVIFPGVGEAGAAMHYLRERGLDTTLKSLQRPVLGICLGLQLLCLSSEESNTPCMGIFDARVKRFPPKDIVPHMGWNELNNPQGPLFENIHPTDNLYFVHSYYAEINSSTIAQCNYIVPFSAALQKNNFYAVQFYPEKSAAVGSQILKNFLAL